MVGRVDLDREAAAGEVVTGRACHVAARAHAAAARDAAVHVAPDERVLVGGLYVAHAPARYDQVVGGDGVLHAELLQVALAQRRTHALQAARRLGLGGCYRETLLDLNELGGALLLGELGHRRALGRLGGAAHLEPHGRALGQPLAQLAELIGVAELVEVGQAAVEGQLALHLLEVFAAQEGIDAQSRSLAAGDGMDGRLGAGDGVASGEHTRRGCAAGVVVSLQGLPRRKRELVVALAKVGHVGHGGDDRGGRHVKARAALLAWLAAVANQAHTLHGRRSAAGDLDAFGFDRVLKVDALLEGGGVVASAGLDAGGVAAREHGHVLGAQALGGAGGVECRRVGGDLHVAGIAGFDGAFNRAALHGFFRLVFIEEIKRQRSALDRVK